MIVQVEHEIPMGHRLMNHAGLCKHLHGHNYLVEVSLSGDIDRARELPTYGMVIDFSHFKRVVKDVLSEYDHAFALQVGDPAADAICHFAQVKMFDLPPTAEVLAFEWAARIASALRVSNERIVVSVRETRDTRAVTGIS